MKYKKCIINNIFIFIKFLIKEPKLLFDILESLNDYHNNLKSRKIN